VSDEDAGSRLLVSNDVFVEAGRRGAARRWGPPRVVRLDSLNADERRLVLAMVEAAKGAATSDHEVTAQEVRRDGANTTSRE
jgi:hypothetical protein